MKKFEKIICLSTLVLIYIKCKEMKCRIETNTNFCTYLGYEMIRLERELKKEPIKK